MDGNEAEESKKRLYRKIVPENDFQSNRQTRGQQHDASREKGWPPPNRLQRSSSTR